MTNSVNRQIVLRARPGARIAASDTKNRPAVISRLVPSSAALRI